MYRKTALVAALLLIATSVQAQRVKVTGAGNATLGNLLNSPTLVTVVLNVEGNPEDANLRVVEIQSAYVKFVKPDGESVTYPNNMIAELRVQGGSVEQADFAALRNQALHPEELEIVNSAWDRINTLYESANRVQNLKIGAAALLALRGNQGALNYLQRLTESNDFQAQFDAATALYLAGQSIPDGLLRSGFESGRLDIQGRAAELAGLIGDQSAVQFLDRMLYDRSAELAAPAAGAYARLGRRDVIPQLISMLTGVNEAKGEAALKALVILGGEDTVEQLKMQLNITEGQRKFRVMRALHLLGDKEGTQRIAQALETDPIAAPEAAKILAAQGDWAASQYLRQRLDRREDPTENNELNRVHNAAALIAGGDSDATAVLQNMLSSEFGSVKILVCDKIAILQKNNLLTLLRPGIENISPAVAFHASVAAISRAEPEYRERLFKVWGVQ